jgi:hypothetical protein
MTNNQQLIVSTTVDLAKVRGALKTDFVRLTTNHIDHLERVCNDLIDATESIEKTSTKHAQVCAKGIIAVVRLTNAAIALREICTENAENTVTTGAKIVDQMNALRESAIAASVKLQDIHSLWIIEASRLDETQDNQDDHWPV